MERSNASVTMGVRHGRRSRATRSRDASRWSAKAFILRRACLRRIWNNGSRLLVALLLAGEKYGRETVPPPLYRRDQIKPAARASGDRFGDGQAETRAVRI